MTESQIKDWYAKRVPMSGRLSDYAMLVGQNNRVLSHRRVATAVATTLLGPNPNRVALVVSTNYIPGAGAEGVVLRIFDAAGVAVVSQDLARKPADLALVTPSPFFVAPAFTLSVLDLGIGIQGQVTIALDGGPTFGVTVTELVMSPKCCDYIGGME